MERDIFNADISLENIVHNSTKISDHTHPKYSSYRGNHRSHVKGTGFKAFIRSSWMLRYKRLKH